MNILAAITALAAVGALVGYLVRPIISINAELRAEVATLHERMRAQESRIHVLGELVTQRAAVDELAGYMADWRDEARRRDEKIIASLDRIAARLEVRAA